jgi:hypothetical protein
MRSASLKDEEEIWAGRTDSRQNSYMLQYRIKWRAGFQGSNVDSQPLSTVIPKPDL